MRFSEVFYSVLTLSYIYQTAWCIQRSTTFIRENAFAGRSCSTEHLTVEIDNVVSIFMCAKACLSERTCLSIFYQSETKQCYGCSTGYGVQNGKVPTEHLAGSVYYLGYGYVGCFNEWPRMFGDNFTNFPTLTNEMCLQKCVAEGFRYALTEAKDWCVCGHVLQQHAKVSDTECNLSCKGDPGQICGGHYKGSVFITQP